MGTKTVAWRAWFIWSIATFFYLYEYIQRVIPGTIVDDLMSSYSANAAAIVVDVPAAVVDVARDFSERDEAEDETMREPSSTPVTVTSAGSTPQCSQAPRPVLPSAPMECASST